MLSSDASLILGALLPLAWPLVQIQFVSETLSVWQRPSTALSNDQNAHVGPGLCFMTSVTHQGAFLQPEPGPEMERRERRREAALCTCTLNVKRRDVSTRQNTAN